MPDDGIVRVNELLEDARDHAAHGDLELAEKGYRDAVLVLRQLGSNGAVGSRWRRAMAAARLGFGQLAAMRDDRVKAEQWFRDGLAVCSEEDGADVCAALEKELALLLCARGEPDAAMVGLGRAQALCRHVGDSLGEAEILIHLAGTLRRAGDPTAAASAAERAILIYDDFGAADLAGRALLEIGAAERERGHHDAALEALRAALEIAVEEGAAWRVAALVELAEAALERGEPGEAAALSRRAMAADGCEAVTRGVSLSILGEALVELNDLDAGLAVLDRAVAELSAAHRVYELAVALFRQAKALERRAHPAAVGKARRAAELFNTFGNRRRQERAASVSGGDPVTASV